jgi:hypothetical protein
MCLRPTGDALEALVATQRAIRDAYQTADERIAEADSPFPGEWSCGPMIGGVMITVGDSEMLDEMLSEIVRALERHGVEGSLDLHEHEDDAAAWPALRTPLHMCRVRVAGRRRSRDGGFLWEPDETAVDACLAAAESWRRELSGPVADSLLVSGVGAVTMPLGSDLREEVRLVRTDGYEVAAASLGVDGLRTYGVDHLGLVSLAVGSDHLDEDESWRPALDGLIRFLRDHADLFVYGYVYRLASVYAALYSPTPWCMRSPRLRPRTGPDPFSIAWADECRPQARWHTADAFDDVFAPDAFGVQLLGAEYRDRVPHAEHWRVEPAGTDAVLLAHDRPDAWFGPDGEGEALARARADLEPILYAPGKLRAGGWCTSDDPYI